MTARIAMGVIAVYVLAAVAIGVRTTLTPAVQEVVWPVLVILASFTALLLAIRRRDASLSYFEVGVVYAGFVTLYAAYPLIAVALSRFEFSPTADSRFVTRPPLPSEIASLAWWYAIYVVAFCAAYYLARPRQSVRTQPIHLPGRDVLIAAGALFLVARLFAVFLVWSFGLHPRSYGEEYALVQSLPVLWRQLANVFSGMDVALQIIILAALFCHYRRTKWIIVVFVAALLSFAVLQLGARTQLGIVIVVTMQFRDQLVRRISLKMIAAVGAIGFVLFASIGVLRLEQREFRLPTLAELSGSETDFEGIFANAYDLKYIAHASGAFRGHPSLLFADVAAFVPQQLLPFPKTSAALWYVQTYYPVAFSQGGGLAFGVVAEAVVGYGVAELVIKGVLTAILLALLQRWYVRGRVGVMFLAFYAWVTITSYQMCRNTALSIFSQALYRFLPAAIATLCIAWAFRRGRNVQRRLRGAEVS